MSASTSASAEPTAQLHAVLTAPRIRETIDPVARLANVEAFLASGADPNAAVPGLCGLTAVDLAIQRGDVALVQSLLTAGGLVSRAQNLTFPMAPDLLRLLEDMARADGGACPPATDFMMMSGTAWIGSVQDLEKMSAERSDPVATAANEYNKTQWCEFTRVRRGRWLVFVAHNVQVFFHEACSDIFLVAVVAAATYGGFIPSEWNPVWPSASDITFTGRYTFAQDMNEVAWLCDAPHSGGGSFMDEVRAAPVPDSRAVEKTKAALSLVSARGACVTMSQEYRYGIMASGQEADAASADGNAGHEEALQQCFVCIGKEAMDLPPQDLRKVLDAVLRTKRRSAAQPGATAAFEKTPYRDENAIVPHKRTKGDMVFDRIAGGDLMDGFDELERCGIFVPRGGNRTPVPDDESMAMMVGAFGGNDGEGESVLTHRDVSELVSQSVPSCPLGVTPVECRAVRLLDEMIMAFLHCTATPALENAISAAVVDEDALQRFFADRCFPDHGNKGSLEEELYMEMLSVTGGPQSEAQAAYEARKESLAARLRDFLARVPGIVSPPPPTTLAFSGGAALASRIDNFLSTRVPGGNAEVVAECLSAVVVLAARNILKMACDYHAHALDRRDSSRPLLTAGAMRLEIAQNEDYAAIFARRTKYYYFPNTSSSG